MLTLPIHDVTPFTLLDYPGKTACIVWFSGCNMRCAYCHNPGVVKSTGQHDAGHVLSFLKARTGLLDGVVLSGGEATVYKDIIAFATRIKCMGYAVKLDTNGTRPDVIAELLNNSLLDYIALDYKAPRDCFSVITHSRLFSAFSDTLSLLIAQKNVQFEIRTTVHTDLMDEMAINSIIHDLSERRFRGVYYVQNVRLGETPTLGHMDAPRRPVDIQKIKYPDDFKVEFRNF